MSTKRKRRYRRYLQDPTEPIPRTTAWRHRKLLRDRDIASENCASYDISPSRSPSLNLSSSPHSDTDEDVAELSRASPISDMPTYNEEDILPTNLSDSASNPSDYDETSVRSNGDSDTSTHTESGSNDECEEDYYNVSLEECEILSEPFHAGSTVTVASAVCAIMQFCLHNSLTFKAINELLKLLQILCVAPNKLPRSSFTLKKFFSQFTTINYEHYKLCSSCKEKIDNCKCNTPSSGDLLEIAIDKPLKVIVSRHWNALLWPREKEGDDIIKDIWDAALMQELSKNGNFFSSNKLAFSFSTDGVAVFKSSNVSIWPVYLVILNLPPTIRMNAENILLCGLWIGPTKPPMDKLLEPVVTNVRKLSSEGIIIKTPTGISRIKGKLVLGIFDLPAKASVLTMKQFNGMFGCSVCLHPGKRLSNNARVYLPEEHLERTHATIVDFAEQAIEDGTPVYGVMGLSPLSNTLDLVCCVPVDYLHACLEGVVKMLLHCWVDSNNHRRPYYIGRQVVELDTELMKQTPPSEFSRPPRSIQKHLKYWKASEFRNWALFYSLPLLLQRLPSLYWHHFSLFVCSLHILLKAELTRQEIDAAEKMLEDFYGLIPELYNESCCTHNMHLMSHLCKYVRLWGPLWTHSLFGFESKNGQLKRLFHGKDIIFKQIMHNIDIDMTLQLIKQSLPESNATQFIDKISHAALRNNMTRIDEHCYAVGSQFVINLTNEQQQAVRLEQRTCEIFQRLYYKGIIFHSTYYVKEKNLKRNNCICSFTNEQTGHIQYGCIEFFVAKPEPIALVNILLQDDTTLMQQSGHPCRAQLNVYKEVDLLSTVIKSVVLPAVGSNLKTVRIKNICGKPVIVHGVNKTYLVSQPNVYECH